MVDSSNAYLEKRKTESPNLRCFQRKNESRPFTMGEMYHFLAITYYMGVVRLPSKDDYWSTNKWMPSHPICTKFGMHRMRFKFLWRHLHVECDDEDNDNDSAAGDSEIHSDDEDDETQPHAEVLFEQEQEGEDEHTATPEEADDTNENNNENENTTTPPNTNNIPEEKPEVWFKKLSYLVNHFRDVSEDMVYILGTNLAIDEMLIRFLGKSMETHRLKNKPIAEGYKFFVLATSNGFVLNVTPDGRTAAKKGLVEWSNKKRSNNNGSNI